MVQAEKNTDSKIYLFSDPNIEQPLYLIRTKKGQVYKVSECLREQGFH